MVTVLVIKIISPNDQVQVDPYLEDALCSSCGLRQGPYYCRDLNCFKYFCRTCWDIQVAIFTRLCTIIHSFMICFAGCQNGRSNTTLISFFVGLMPLIFYPPASEASREVANLTERKNPHTPQMEQLVQALFEDLCDSIICPKSGR